MNGRFLASAFYLLFFAAGGALFPFLTLYFKDIGMETGQIGILTAVGTVAVLFGAPLWGGIADLFHLHKIILPAAAFGAVGAVVLMSLARSFWWLLTFALLLAFFTSPIMPLADNAALVLLGENAPEYGRLRIWGAVGFGISALVTGYLSEGLTGTAIFIAYAVLMTTAGLLAFKLPEPPPIEQADYWQRIGQLASNRRWLTFIIAVLLVATCSTMLDKYFILFLAEKGAGEGLYGLSVAAAGVSELPVYWSSVWLLRTLKPRSLLIVAFGVYTLRSLIYASIQNPEWAVAAQLLHGLSFSAMWTASVIFAGKAAPPGLGASSQAILGAVFFGVAGGTGALLGAALYDSVGPENMFRAAGGLALTGLLIFGLSELITGQTGKSAL